MTNALSLRVGDRLPDFVLPGLDGKLRKFIWSFTGEPVASIHLPHRIPPGFHGNWVAD